MSFDYPDVGTPSAYLATRDEIWDLTNEGSCQWLRSYLPRFESFVIEGIPNEGFASLGNFTDIWYKALQYYVPSLPENPSGVQRAVALFVDAPAPTADYYKTDAVLVQGSNSIAYREDFVPYGPVQIFDLQSAADAVQLDVNAGSEPLSVTLPGGVVELQLSSTGLVVQRLFWSMDVPVSGKLYTTDRVIEALQSPAPEGVKFVRTDPLTMIYENQQPGNSNNLEVPYVFRNYNFTVI